MSHGSRLVMWLVGVGLMIAGGVGLSQAVAADDGEASPTQQPAVHVTRSNVSSTSSAATSSSSSGGPSHAKLEQKLNEILANQQEILKRFDAVMEELRVIKVRTTIAASRS